jgi:hypothetical protein
VFVRGIEIVTTSLSRALAIWREKLDFLFVVKAGPVDPKDFESCETVSIAESAQCSLVRYPAQLVTCLPRRKRREGRVAPTRHAVASAEEVANVEVPRSRINL